MTASPSIDVSGWLSDQLAQASPDLLRVLSGQACGPGRTAVLTCWERRVLCHTSTVLCSLTARSFRARLSCARRGDVRLCPAGSGHGTIGG